MYTIVTLGSYLKLLGFFNALISANFYVFLMDLNINLDSYSDQTEVVASLVQRAYEFGYECIALNTIIDKGRLSGKNISIPEPKTIDFQLKGTRNFRIMSRLTAIIEDGLHAHHLFKSPVTKKYDIIALQPIGEKMLQHVCSNFDCDIICLDFTQSLGFTLKRTHVGLAVHKGACFEISYAPCLRSQSVRRHIISNAQLLVGVTKSKNIIISSGATKPLELRSAEDLSNLALLFGCSKEQAHAAVRKTGQLVLSHAATRNKTGCGFVSITGMYKLPKHQGWIVKACKVPKMSSDATSSSSAKRKSEAVADAEDEESSVKKIKV